MTFRRLNLEPNRSTPALPTGTRGAAQQRLMQALSEAIDVHGRRTRDKANSFVRVEELVDIGVLQVNDTGVTGAVQPTYIPQEAATRHYRPEEFRRGHNVIGVRYAGTAHVYLPASLSREILITVKDEAGTGAVQLHAY